MATRRGWGSDVYEESEDPNENSGMFMAKNPNTGKYVIKNLEEMEELKKSRYYTKDTRLPMEFFTHECDTMWVAVVIVLFLILLVCIVSIVFSIIAKNILSGSVGAVFCVIFSISFIYAYTAKCGRYVEYLPINKSDLDTITKNKEN